MATKGGFLSRSQCFGMQEDGGITAFAIISISLMLLIMGAAVDVANAYRHQTQLQITADAAARAGLVALAQGEDTAGARRATEAMIEKNLPRSRYGQLVTDPATELQILHYDATTGKLDHAGTDTPANAVLVRLQRSEVVDNPLPTFVMGIAGLQSWSLAVTSVAVLVPTRHCGNAEGIVARGRLDLGPSPEFGDGFCLHSQSAISLPIRTRSAGPLRISLPDPSGCEGVCALTAGASPSHPDTRPIALNLIMPETRDHVLRLAEGFRNPAVELPEEAAFFATRPLDGDPEALREVGLNAQNIRKGDVLRLTALQFSQMRERPSGLVYDVRCDTVEHDPRPAWEWTLTLLGNGYSPTLHNLVLVTDCAIEMDDTVRVEGTLIFMTGPGEARISALPGATLGDPEAKCDPTRRVRLMTPGDLALPANLTLSNVSAVAGGAIRLEESSDLWIATHNGLVLHAGGTVIAEGVHRFTQCPTEAPSDALMPAMQVISHTLPNLSGVLSPPAKPRKKTDLPGKAKGRMKMDSEVRPGS